MTLAGNTRPQETSKYSLVVTLLNPAALTHSAKKYEVDGNLFEIITSEETHYFFQAATSDERKEWINAIQSVSRIGK